MIAGALPKPGRDWLEERVPFWNAQWASLISGLLEGIFGSSFLQGFLIGAGIQNAFPRGGAVLLAVGGFLVAEGIVRIILSTQRSGVVALPVLAMWRAAQAIASLWRRGRDGSRSLRP